MSFRPTPSLSVAFAGWAAAVCLLPPRAAAQVSALRYDPARVHVGRVHQYEKANRDGSHSGRVSLYVAAPDRLESLKWDDEIGWATFVVAELDWTRFSVRRFESWALRQGRPAELKATLHTAPDGAITISVLPGPPVRVSSWPWHSYDFDWASLSAVLPHRVDAEAEFGFLRADFIQEEGQGPRFGEIGAVRLRYQGREQRGGVATRRYRMEGAGLLAPGQPASAAPANAGTVWTDASDGHIVEFELPFPDEPGLRDVRFRQLAIETMTAAEWEAFKRRRLGD